ncbi:MAG: TolC family protein [Planctomycetaceae bacterium]|nr:TolC family protein [Planctomycetaceae bacterium]
MHYDNFKSAILSAAAAFAFSGCAQTVYRTNADYPRNAAQERSPAAQSVATGELEPVPTPGNSVSEDARIRLTDYTEEASPDQSASAPVAASPADSETPSAAGKPPAEPPSFPETSAADDGSDLPSITLAEVEQLALENNPSIQQSAAAAGQADSLRDQVGLRPNPTFGYFGSQLADRNTDQHGLYVDQEFVRGNKLHLNRCVLQQTAQARLWDVETQKQRVCTDIRMRFFEAMAAQQQLNATLSFTEVAERGVQAATERQQAGEASQVEVLQSRIQLNEVRLAGRQARAAFEGAWNDLISVAGVPYMTPRRLEADLGVAREATDWDAVYADIVQRSPELSAAAARVREASAMVRRQEAQPIPNINVQLGAGVDNGTDAGLINLQVGAPIPVHNDNHGNISAAYAEYCRATHEVRRLELSLRARLARAVQDYESALAAVTKYEDEILPDAGQTLKLSEQAYKAGELDFLQVLIVRRTYFDSNIRYIQARGQLAQANARIHGLLLTGGLDINADTSADDGLRGQSFGGQ